MRGRSKIGTCGKGAEVWSLKASLTVEAALVMSVLLLVLAGCLQKTITMYRHVQEKAQVNWLEIRDMDQAFRIRTLGRDLME